MKRFVIFAVATSLTLFLIFCFATVLMAEVALLEEGFESYKVDETPGGKWEVVGAVPVTPTFYIANFPIHSGEKSLRVAYPTGTNETMGIKFDPNMRRVIFTCFTYPTSDKQTTFQAIVGGNPFRDPKLPPAQPLDADAYIGSYVTFANDGSMKYYSAADGWTDTGAKYKRRDWNQVGIEADLKTQTYNISLNNVVVVQGAPFWHILTELNTFAIRRSPQAEGGETFYVDDIVCTGISLSVESKNRLATMWGSLKVSH